MNYLQNNEYQNKLSILLEYKIKKYTAGLTSTIPIEIAKQINNSNIYTLKIYLKNNIKQIIETNNIIELYNQSKKELDKTINKTKLFYNIVILNNLLETNNYFYNATLKEGIKGFFKIYNPDYNADEIKVTIDYEPFLERPKTKGIIFIKEYLEYINYENIFCNNFNYHNLLNQINNDLPISIYEIVFTRALLVELLNQNIYELELKNINSIYKIKQLDKKLNIAYINIKNKLNLNNEYYDKTAKIIIKNIKKQIERKTLNNLLYTNKQITYKTNKKMNPIKLNKIIKNPTQQNINQIQSLVDLIELLDQTNIEPLKLYNIFQKLNTIELTALKNHYALNDSYISKELEIYIKTKSKKEQELINNNYQNIIIEEIY